MKLVRNSAARKDAGAFELYDLGKDIGETQDLAAEQPKVAADLKAELEKIDASMVPPAWTPAR